MEINGKVVLITGASEGIGLATARVFAQAGAKLALTARSTDKLEVLAGELRGMGAEAVAVPADLTDMAQVREAVTDTLGRFGRLDILINNAGQAAAGAVAELALEHLEYIMTLNVYAPIVAIQAAVPAMRAQGGGLIINVSSMVSKMRIPGLGAYACTKAALNMISDTARGELAGAGIKVISVFPRLTATDFGKHSLGDHALRRRQRATEAPVPIDTAEHVAARILKGAVEEPDEQYMD